MTSLFEACLDSQRNAGFKTEDRRVVQCPSCGADGYNSGWGFWHFECGAEILTSGHADAPSCGAKDKP